MHKIGYELEFSATAKLIFADPTASPEEGFFYIKALLNQADAPMVISSFTENHDIDQQNNPTILADFWEEGVQASWYKEDEDDAEEPWTLEISGSLIIQPLSHPDPEEWRLEEGEIALLQLEFRRDGDSPPEEFDFYEFIEGSILSVTTLIKDDEDEWDEDGDAD